MPAQTHPDLLVGLDTLDDAGVFRLSVDLALVQTVDFFPPLVDDPYQFGQIAAANALSDVYAMGGEPLTALSIVGFPDQELGVEVLQEILRGGADKLREAGAVLVGGHSVRDAEIKFGLAVTGRVHPLRMLTNAAARPGDVLVLTKPIGSGVLAGAAKSGRITTEQFAEAIETMSALNGPAARAALQAGVQACTDITGFGLVGHSGSMAKASKVSLRIESARVPLLQGALDLARAGLLTRAHRSTRDHLGELLAIAPDVDPALAGLLCDAQTSGGLLLCVAPSRAAELIEALRASGSRCAAAVGRAEHPQPHRIIVV